MVYNPHAQGAMYIYDSAVATPIDAANQYHAVKGFSDAGMNEGVTFGAGSSGAITSTADNGGTLRCTDATHGLATGDIITLVAMGDAAHVGLTRVTVIDPNTFDCDDIAYNSAADTGNWYMGSYLQINTGHGGDYLVAFSMSSYIGTANKNIKIELVKNITALDTFATERNYGNTALGVSAAVGQVSLQAGDRVWMQAENTTDTTDFTIKHANINLHKI